MARAKKEAALTSEERLQAALVPDWEWPYKLPENWCWTYLTKAAECLDSFRKPVNATERSGRTGEIPYYGATGQVGWIDDFLTDEELVLLGEDGAPFLDLIKDKAYLISGKAWVNNHAHILRSHFGTVGNKYLLNYLNSFNYTGYVNGTTRLKLTQASMDIMPIPLAPLAEQQRIVDRIESLFAKLDEAKEKAQAVLDSFETRKAAILHKAFTGELTAKWREEHGANISQWKNCTIGDVFAHTTGKALKKSNQNGVLRKYITTSNLYWGTFDFSEVREMHFTEDELEKCTAKKGDLLLCNGGDVGRAAIWDYDYEICLQNHISKLRKKAENVDVPFFYYYFMLSKIDGNIAGRGIGIASLSARDLLAMSLYLPPMAEQQQISRILDDLFAKEQQAKEAAEAVLEKIDLMKKAILARAFRGELGTNDPNDESAMELLKKIMDIPAEPKPAVKRKYIPKELEQKIKTDLERKIIRLYIHNETDCLTMDQLMGVSSKKFDILEALRNLQNRGILIKENDTYKLMG